MSLQWVRLAIRNIGARKYHTSKCLSLFHEFPDKEGYQIKSEEEKEWEKSSYWNKVQLEYQLIKEGLKETYNEVKDGVMYGPKRLWIPEHVVDVVHRFKGDKEDLKKWIVTADSDHSLGFSTASLDFSPDSKGVFHGFIDTKVPPDGQMKRTGFCNLKLEPNLSPFKRKIPHEWSPFTHLVFHIRGDGRVYTVNLHVQSYCDLTMYDTYHYFIWTRGGPYWQHVRIPFSKFFFGYKGRLQASNYVIPKHEINTISFTIADKITGPFKLEIDYIGVENDPTHIEETAYEQYNVDPDQRFW